MQYSTLQPRSEHRSDSENKVFRKRKPVDRELTEGEVTGADWSTTLTECAISSNIEPARLQAGPRIINDLTTVFNTKPCTGTTAAASVPRTSATSTGSPTNQLGKNNYTQPSAPDDGALL